MDNDTAMKIGNAFGGGMGLMGGTCGAVTGAFIILGLKFGSADVRDKASKAKTYDLVKGFAAEFEASNGSLSCRELLGFDIGSREKTPGSGKIISKKCPALVNDSIEILGTIYREHGIEEIPKGAK